MTEKISITLPDEMVSVIKEQVQSGRYASTSEVLRDAMRVWMRDDQEHADRLTAIRSRIQRSLADPRPTIDLDEGFARIIASAKIKARQN